MKNPAFLLFCLAVLLPGSLSAQSENEAEAPPLYDVEVVIFKNVKAPRSREFVLPVSSPSRDEKLLDLSSAGSVAAAAKRGYRVLPAEEFRLQEIAERMNESERYEVLLHASWRQPGVERERALPVWLKGGRIYGPEYTSIDNRIDIAASVPRAKGGETAGGQNYSFDEQTLEALELQVLEQKNARGNRGLYEFEGKITISLGRYLHAHTDLVFRRPRLSIDPVASNPIEQQYLSAHAADTRILNNHALKEHRRMRSRNLHYLDNPEFGILILITPYQAPVATEPAAAQDSG